MSVADGGAPSAAGNTGTRLDLSSWLFLAAVLGWSVAPHALLHRWSFHGVGATSLINALVLLLVVPCVIRHGVEWRAAPILAAYTWILAATYTFTSWFPGLSPSQPLKSYAALLLAPFLFQVKQPEALRRALLAGLPWMPVLCVLAGVIAGATLDWRWILHDDFGALRLRGFTFSAHLALLGVAALMAALGARRQSVSSRVFALTLFAIVVWTGTRIPTLCALLLFVAFIARDHAPTSRRRTLATCAALAVILLSYAPYAQKRFVRSVPAQSLPGPPTSESPTALEPPILPSLDSFNDSGRMSAWSAYLDRAREGIWLGRGLGAATIPVSRAYVVPHNEFLRILVDGGIVGLAFAGIGYGVVFVRGIRRAPDAYKPHLLGCVAVFVVLCLTDNPISAQLFAVPFWAYLSCVTGAPATAGAPSA